MNNKNIPLICLHKSEMIHNNSNDSEHYDIIFPLNKEQIANINKTGKIALSFFTGEIPEWVNPYNKENCSLGTKVGYILYDYHMGKVKYNEIIRTFKNNGIQFKIFDFSNDDFNRLCEKFNRLCEKKVEVYNHLYGTFTTNKENKIKGYYATLIN